MHSRRLSPTWRSMFLAVLVAVAVAAIFAACGGRGDDAADSNANGQNANGDPAPTQGQTAINRICPPPEGDEDDGFCAYIAHLDSDVRSGNFAQLLNNLSGREISCTGTDGPCEEPGETIEVVQFTRNDDGAELRVDDARDRMAAVLSGIERGAADEIASGELQLYAIATGVTEVRDKAVVLTGIHANGDERRITLMVTVVFHQGEWLLTSVNLRDEGAEDFLAEIDKRQGAGSFWKWQLAKTIGDGW